MFFFRNSILKFQLNLFLVFFLFYSIRVRIGILRLGMKPSPRISDEEGFIAFDMGDMVRNLDRYIGMRIVKGYS